MGPGDERFAIASLGDLMELVVEGWRIASLHYADRSPGTSAPAAYFVLSRGAGERQGVFIPDDGRALSHRALVALFRESPRIWKHRSPDAIPAGPPEGGDPPEEWGEVPEPFPQAVPFGPATLRDVVAVGQVQSVEGLDIALIALERHESGARLQYMCHASGARARRQMAMLDVAVVDDAGRLYRVAPADDRAEGNRLDGVLAVAPAIPSGTRRLTVTVGTVGDPTGGPDRAEGPWVFPIPLAAPA